MSNRNDSRELGGGANSNAAPIMNGGLASEGISGSLTYDSEAEQICFTHRKITFSFNVDKIKKVTRHVSFRYYAKGPQILAWDTYNHSIIELYSGETVIITSLLIPDLDLPVSKDKIIIERDIFRLVKEQSLQI